jgi:hypothetical protein
MKRRLGATLVEVLVAIFVMGIGLLALLALFPVGALSMARAIKDSRAAFAGANATSIAVALDLRNERSHLPNTLATGLFAYKNPDSLTSTIFTNALVDGPSYAVYLDPTGYLSYPNANNYKMYLAGTQRGGIPRRSIAAVGTATAPTNRTAAVRWCTLLDDLRFNTTGVPTATGNNAVRRDTTYSCAWLVRRPKHGVPSVVEMSVVVYANRPMSLNANLDPPEYEYTGTWDPTSPRTVQLTWNAAQQAAPPIRAGGWILDATRVPANGPPFRPGHATFYRVVSVGDSTVNANQQGTVELELERPIREFPANVQGVQTVHMIIIEGVIEVFEKGTSWNPGSAGPTTTPIPNPF